MDTGSDNRKELSFWENVRKLVHIYFLQQRKAILAFLCGMLIASLYVFLIHFSEIRHMLSTGSLQSQYVIGGYGGLIHFGMFILLFTSCNMLVNKKISMFPGNVWSRYIARQLVDYSLFLGYVLLIGLLYLLHSALFWLLLHQNTGIDFRYLFDVRYLGLGMLQLYLLWMLCRGIQVIPLAIHAKWGNRVIMGVAVAFVLLCICLFVFYPEVLMQIFAWWSEYVIKNENFFSFVRFALAIWFVGTLLSFLLISRMRKWRNSHDNVPILIGCFFWTCWSMMLGLHFEVSINTERIDSYAIRDNQPYSDVDYLSGQILVKAETIGVDFPEKNPLEYACVNDSNGQKSGRIGEYFDLYCDYVITSVSQANQEGIPEGVDLSGVDKEHILYYFQLPDIQIHGQHIYREWLDDLEEHLLPVEDYISFRMEYCGELKTNLWNDFFPHVDRFLYPDGQITMHDWYLNAPYRARITAILDEENYEKVTEE